MRATCGPFRLWTSTRKSLPRAVLSSGLVAANRGPAMPITPVAVRNAAGRRRRFPVARTLTALEVDDLDGAHEGAVVRRHRACSAGSLPWKRRALGTDHLRPGRDIKLVIQVTLGVIAALVLLLVVSALLHGRL
jgi:hypothetical protein